MQNEQKSELLISYLTLRKFLGILGILLPILLILGGTIFGKCDAIQLSISDYFHTPMRDYFVATISSMAFFLFTYKGYDKKDNLLCNIAGIAALLIAFCPTYADPLTNCMNESMLANQSSLIGKIHLFAAATFFILIMQISMFQFTKGSSKTPEKKMRNQIYRACGITIFISLLIIALYFLYLEKEYPFLTKYKPVFWLETIALFAFGISWLIKGDTLFRDSSGSNVAAN
ncbi:MAG: hypothetical protein AB8H03_12190 [Saprospiraceae bacterium]